MATNNSRPTDESSAELERVSEQIAARLRARGVTVNESDSSDDLGSLLEAVEAFESAVESQGGDLMMDEAPAGKTAEPDNANFVLPARGADESASDYIVRIDEAAAGIRK